VINGAHHVDGSLPHTKIDIAINSFGAKRLRAGSALEAIRRGRRGSAGSALEHRQRPSRI
jgi:hypothetical protein